MLPTGTSLSQKGIKTAPLPDIPRVLSRFHGAAWENAFLLLPCVSQACRVRFQSCEFVLHAQKKILAMSRDQAGFMVVSLLI